jgi:hypothetical protein
MDPAGTIADRAYAPKPGAPARPAIVREACQQLAGGENSTGETLLTQNQKHYLKYYSSEDPNRFLDRIRHFGLATD